MKRTLLFILAGLLLAAQAGWSHSPRKIEMFYDEEEKLLHMDIGHVSDELDEHYIRKVIVTVNDQEPLIKYFRMQRKPPRFIVDVGILAKTGDTIAVKVYCSEGGSISEKMIVPEDSGVSQDVEEEQIE